MNFRIRRLVGVMLVVVAATVGLLVGQGATPARACTQPVGGHPQRSIEERNASAEIVAVGTVVGYFSRSDHTVYDTAIVEVERYHVGSGPSVIVVTGFGNSVMCLQTLAEGQRYIFWLRQDASSIYRADYAGTVSGAFWSNDESMATLTAVSGEGLPPANDGLSAEAVATQYGFDLAATQVSYLGTYQPYLLTYTAEAAGSRSPTPAPQNPTSDTGDDNGLGGLLTSMLLCLSTMMGPLAVLTAVQGRRNSSRANRQD